jgi:hypothetical protein
VKSIGVDTFENCCKLRTIRYGGTIAQWKKIARYRPAVSSRRVVRCTDGDTGQWK